ncbi:GNAT family N-acetyltransferase [Nocardioides panacis]|uniref:GNAT family N-acetyltransferase n=1 Tax=Nocardioides panacis TaxID=2849501 RepID=A0A975T3R2_9ACTN|nr:GNAT family N-acetyltransferase [Nocardioides panacis]QWZ10323.1 GNAT family N-acetyltransferase [Nocardioides panacis]
MPSEPDLTVRPATPEDADALATLYLSARAAAFPAVPPTVHPEPAVRRWMRSLFDVDGVEVWLAERGDVPVGLLVLEDDWLHSLYVDPRLTGQGIGSTLLELAKGLRPGGFGLWVFEANAGAQRFYARHGLGVVRRTDGSDNEEGEPDLEMAWPDPSSLPGLRRRIDAVDDRLAALLAERAGLTARVQELKDVPGEAGRDRRREDEIVARMARVAPSLGEERLRRIMAQVIAESLDAAARPGTEQNGPSGS